MRKCELCFILRVLPYGTCLLRSAGKSYKRQDGVQYNKFAKSDAKITYMQHLHVTLRLLHLHYILACAECCFWLR